MRCVQIGGADEEGFMRFAFAQFLYLSVTDERETGFFFTASFISMSEGREEKKATLKAYVSRVMFVVGISTKTLTQSRCVGLCWFVVLHRSAKKGATVRKGDITAEEKAVRPR